MDMSLSSEADSCSTTQEITHILRNSKVNCRVHKSTALVPISSRKIPSTHFRPNPSTSILILSSCLRLIFPSTLFPWGSHTKNWYNLLSYACSKLCPSNLPSVDHSNDAWWRVRTIGLTFTHPPPRSRISSNNTHVIVTYVTLVGHSEILTQGISKAPEGQLYLS
jgi:hypothetical protein